MQTSQRSHHASSSSFVVRSIYHQSTFDIWIDQPQSFASLRVILYIDTLYELEYSTLISVNIGDTLW